MDLRLPEVRVLEVLTGVRMLSRAKIGERAGFSERSGTLNYVLNGVRVGSSSSKEYPGLLALKLVERQELDIDGLKEVYYRITPDGRKALQQYLDGKGPLPPLRDRVRSTNRRYKK